MLVCKLEGCGKEIKGRKRTFCRDRCRHIFHGKMENQKAKRFKSEHKHKLIPCLGPRCRGEKMFYSTGPFNRICKSCKLTNDIKDGMDLYSYKGNGRSNGRSQ